MPEIDVAAAQAALDAAGGMPEVVPAVTAQEMWNRDDAGRFTAESNKPTEPPAGDAPAVPAPDATTPPAETADEPAFTSIPDESLTPELLQMKRALQADYTRKTQEAAPWRKLGDELGLSAPDEFRTAAEVYQRIQDPRNWPTIHGELTEYMQQYGMTPQQASVAASNQLAQFAPDQQADAQTEQHYVDPDADPGVTALQQQIAQLTQQVSALTGQTQQREQERVQQEQWNAVAQNLTAQETALRAQNPHYDDDAITAIYHLMDSDGNMTAAAQKFDSLIGNQVAKYIGSKTTVATTVPVTPPGGGVIPAPEAPGRMTLDQGHAAAMAAVRALDAEDATS